MHQYAIGIVGDGRHLALPTDCRGSGQGDAGGIEQAFKRNSGDAGAADLGEGFRFRIEPFVGVERAAALAASARDQLQLPKILHHGDALTAEDFQIFLRMAGIAIGPIVDGPDRPILEANGQTDRIVAR